MRVVVSAIICNIRSRPAPLPSPSVVVVVLAVERRHHRVRVVVPRPHALCHQLHLLLVRKSMRAHCVLVLVAIAAAEAVEATAKAERRQPSRRRNPKGVGVLAKGHVPIPRARLNVVAPTAIAARARLHAVSAAALHDAVLDSEALVREDAAVLRMEHCALAQRAPTRVDHDAVASANHLALLEQHLVAAVAAANLVEDQRVALTDGPAHVDAQLVQVHALEAHAADLDAVVHDTQVGEAKQRARSIIGHRDGAA
mmetsp:Transcript_20630/g.64620  ORF Transcript_20630/g.64620 Transcript_20630/m.64620 type:complete len:255 (-) Transcript_20630:960-1724(-)